jgi:hypothetical protein
MEVMENNEAIKRRTVRRNGTYLTARKLAARWKISLSQAYRLGERGIIPVLRIAGSIRFDLADVERYETAHRTGGEGVIA